MMINTRILLSVMSVGLFAAGAQAETFTEIQGPATGEKSQEEILEDFFGLELDADGNGFAGGNIVVTRVSDDADESYDAESFSAETIAAYAMARQSFGTAADGVLFDVEGKFDNPTSGSVTDAAGGTDIHFGRFGNDCGTVDVTTDSATNPSGKDHVVTYTYTIDGQEQVGKYILFYEDANETSDVTDWDYNDLVVEVTLVPVPEPSSLALIALGGLAMLRRRR